MVDNDKSQSPKERCAVFISYSRSDFDFVDRLCPALRSHAFSVFLDRKEIYATEDWWKRIETLIVKADTVICVLSPDALTSPVCANELAFAVSLKKRLAPIVCRNIEISAVPEPLRRLHFIRFDTKEDFAASAEALANALLVDIDWVREHTWLTEIASRWTTNGRPNSMLLRGGDLLAATRWLEEKPMNGPEPSDLLLTLISRSADQTRERTRSLDEAAHSSNRMIANVVEQLRGQKGVSQALIKGILQDAETLVHAFDADDAPNIRRAKAVALVELSSTLVLQKDYQGALAAAETAITIFDEFHRDQPDSSDCLSDMLVALDRAGDAHFELAHYDQALTAYARSLELARRLITLHPDDPASSRHFSVALEKVADGLRNSAQLGEALTLYRDSFSLRESIARATDKIDAWRDVAISLSRIAETLVSLGQEQEAHASYEASLRLLGKAMQDRPTSSDLQRESALVHERLGLLYSHQGALDFAHRHYETALAALLQLVDYDHANFALMSDAYRLFNRVGCALLALKRSQEALEVFERALALARNECSNISGDVNWQATSAFYQRTCDVLNSIEGAESACALASEAAAFLDSIDNHNRSSHVAQALGNVAWYSLLSKTPKAAIIAAERAHDLLPHNLSLCVNLFYSLVLCDRIAEAAALFSECKREHATDSEFSNTLKRDIRELKSCGVLVDTMTALITKYMGDDTCALHR